MSEKLTRLSVNLNKETAKALKDTAQAEKITYTETIRRGIAVYKFLTDEVRKGRVITIADKNGDNAKEVLFL